MFKSTAGFRELIPTDVSKITRVFRSNKLTVFSLSLGIALLGTLAIIFRNYRKLSQLKQKKLDGKNQQQQSQSQHQHQSHHTHPVRPQGIVFATANRSASSSLRKLRSSYLTRTQVPNGDVTPTNKKNISSSVDSSNFGSGDVGNLWRHRAMSASMNSLGGLSNASNSSTITHSGLDTVNMSSADLCQLGMENLALAISYWEDAVMKLSYLDDQPSVPGVLAIPDSETADLQHKLENLLDLAYRMQDNYERLCERQVEHIALESALAVLAERDKDKSFDDDSSDQESFVSATDMAHLTDLDFNRDILHHVPLYEAGMLELKYGNVPCRTIRPEMVQCLSDVEFLAKLYGIRLAFQMIFQDDNKRVWFTQVGKKLIGDLLIKADRDVEEFYTSYDKMMQFISVESNWPLIEEELRGRGVRCLSFYDIVLDFILMDAFDDLANPPSTVMTVVQNRWLSNGFKETALATALWSVLKAKRSLLKFNDGFISHFYSISEHTSPLLAWGFLGPNSELKELCLYFKGLVLGFIRDIFSFEKVRFTTVEALAEDILKLAEVKSDNAAERMKSNSPDITPVASFC